MCQSVPFGLIPPLGTGPDAGPGLPPEADRWGQCRRRRDDWRRAGCRTQGHAVLASRRLPSIERALTQKALNALP